jgi:hypothetical protein
MIRPRVRRAVAARLWPYTRSRKADKAKHKRRDCHRQPVRSAIQSSFHVCVVAVQVSTEKPARVKAAVALSANTQAAAALRARETTV